MTNPKDPGDVSGADWQRLLALAEARRRGTADAGARRRAWQAIASNTYPIDLYECLVTADAPFALGHLGQSLDGCIATASGHSVYVTGEANLDHLHRLRALADAVVVGAGTVAADDPRLTVRRVEGPSPVRVVLDRSASLAPTFGLFTDAGPETLRVVATGQMPAGGAGERCVEVAEVDGRLSPMAVRDALAERGLRVLFIEGGGITVSRWLEAGALDRLHIAIAPVIIGRGRRGLDLPSAQDMSQARRPPARSVRMGEDVLFDLALG